jgi:hypothetical protein
MWIYERDAEHGGCTASTCDTTEAPHLQITCISDLNGEDGPAAGAREVLLDDNADNLWGALVRGRAIAPQHLEEEALAALGVALVPKGLRVKGWRWASFVNM